MKTVPRGGRPGQFHRWRLYDQPLCPGAGEMSGEERQHMSQKPCFGAVLPTLNQHGSLLTQKTRQLCFAGIERGELLLQVLIQGTFSRKIQKMPCEIHRALQGGKENKSTLLLRLAIWCTKLCRNKDANTSVLINAVVLTRKNICKIPVLGLKPMLQLEISAIKH